VRLGTGLGLGLWVVLGLLLMRAFGVEEGLKGNEECLSCHSNITPGVVMQWQGSRHGKANVGCEACHKASRQDKDAVEHFGQLIAVVVTPKDCAACHPKESNEFQNSRHAKARQFIGSLDNYLGEVLGGPEAVTTGCEQCHGSKLKFSKAKGLHPDTWPNSGIGRENPDGSLGSCSACHARHGFSKAQAREPQTCGRCHMGPDHPQKEIYEESMHGILYLANKDKMRLDSDSWVVGKDYGAAPTCATCHMSATPKQAVTHDVGERISWTLRPPVSKKLKNSAQRRLRMQEVCTSCHARPFVESFYKQFDNLVNLYNDKFAKPATAIKEELIQKGKLTKADFDEKLDWVYYELWHHEGRRARHGASMAGPDYAWWHGMYEVAKHFYTEFLPEVERVAGKDLYRHLIECYLKPDVRHAWFFEGMSKEQVEKVRTFYEQRYDKP